MAQIHEVEIRDIGENPRGAQDFSQAKASVDVAALTGIQSSMVIVLQNLDPHQTEKFGQFLADPVSQTFQVDPSEEGITVGYKPGVTNPATAALLEAASDLNLPLVAADVRVRRRLEGDLTEGEVQKVMSVFVNPQVQEITIGVPETLLITGEEPKTQRIPIIDADKDQLRDISKDKLFLDESEMQYIQDFFRNLGRNPTDAELETIAGRWSEHCVHKTFKADIYYDRDELLGIAGEHKDPLFKRLKDTARKHFKDLVWSAFEDNSGVIAFQDGYGIAIKWETHNSPSALDPVGGAATGTGGVLRDDLGTGTGISEINGSMYAFVVGDMDQDPLTLPSKIIHPRKLLQGLQKGVEYGNTVGIPTNNGSVHIHPDFAYKPTVLVGAWGVIKEERAQKGHPQIGDLVVVIGGRTGRDGIHGATFSSAAMTDRTVDVNRAAVQLGDPIEEKKIKDVVIAAGEAGIIRAVTDCGAAGLSSAVGEMGEETGVLADVSKLPVKYEGLAPWEKWMSESQERMVLAIAPENIHEFLSISKKFESEATVIGEFTDTKRLVVLNGSETIVDLSYDFLTTMPERNMAATANNRRFSEPENDRPEDWVEAFKKVLSHGNVCSIEPIARQYDHIVQGDSAGTPFLGKNFDGPADASYTTPLKRYGNEKATVIVSHALNPILNRIDPYKGSIWAAQVAMARFVAAGGNPDRAGLVNNYVSGDPRVPENMGALDKMVDAVCDFMDATGAPVISGKDSLSSTYRGEGKEIHIPPVLQISVIGGISDVNKTVSSDIKRTGSSLYHVGLANINMGGSVYYDTLGAIGNDVAITDPSVMADIYRGVHKAIQSGKILSAHAVGEGGIGTAIAQMAFGGDVGVDVNFEFGWDWPEVSFFDEAPGIIVEVSDDETAQKLFKNMPHRKLGITKEEKGFSLYDNGEKIFTAEMNVLKDAWQNPLKEVFPVA